jgi:hypothetical protein
MRTDVPLVLEMLEEFVERIVEHLGDANLVKFVT